MHYLCHYCNKSTFRQFYVKCCKKKCSKLFCLDCIRLKFDKDFKPENVRRDTWICYACGQKCDCIYCDPKGLKRPSCSTSQTSLKLRFSGKLKWYHEKNRGALKTVTFDCVKPVDVQVPINHEEPDMADQELTKLEKRKTKPDLSKIENKYLNKKKAHRECSEPLEHENLQEAEQSKHEKIANLLRSIDLEGSKHIYLFWCF